MEREDYCAWPRLTWGKGDRILLTGAKRPDVGIRLILKKWSLQWCVYSKKNIFCSYLVERFWYKQTPLEKTVNLVINDRKGDSEMQRQFLLFLPGQEVTGALRPICWKEPMYEKSVWKKQLFHISDRASIPDRLKYLNNLYGLQRTLNSYSWSSKDCC